MIQNLKLAPPLQSVSDLPQKKGHKFENEKIIELNDLLADKITKLDMQNATLQKLTAGVEAKINTIVPKITAQIADKHSEYLKEFDKPLKECNIALTAVKENAIKFQDGILKIQSKSFL